MAKRATANSSGSKRASKKKKVATKSAATKRATRTKATQSRNSVATTARTLAANELDAIVIKGAAEHNLKEIDVEIPKRTLTVLTGVSGSGKTSLAFDTLFAEGQRRYVESLSAYARQFLGQMDKPKYEQIRGLAPTISIEQKAASKNPRSTVGTITEIADYLRVLFARVGVQHCHQCGSVVGRGDVPSMVEEILALGEGAKLLLLAPLVEDRKGEHRELFQALRGEGYMRVRIDGVVHELADVTGLSKNKKHTIEVVVDRLVVKPNDAAFRKRLTDSVETTLKHGKGRMIAHVVDGKDHLFSQERSCCGHAFPLMEPAYFSFNSPRGFCPTCNGLGVTLLADEAKVVAHPAKSLAKGAVPFLRECFNNGGKIIGTTWTSLCLRAMQREWDLDVKTPWNKLPKKLRERLLYGDPKGKHTLTIRFRSGDMERDWEGLLPMLGRRWRETESENAREYYARFLSERPCPACHGTRLRPEAAAVKVGGASIVEFAEWTIGHAYEWMRDLALEGNQAVIAAELQKEIGNRLRFLVDVGLEYLTLNRPGPTLSGGEAQRIRLASQVGSELTGVIYVLDEPSIGLHPRDSARLVRTLKHLRDIGNTVVVVEHDLETIEAADHILDFGPGAGHLGGHIVVAGNLTKVKRSKDSLTGQYLAGKRRIELPAERRDGNKTLRIRGANEHNLRNIDVEIPLGTLTLVTGVSGAGKSTLINQILFPAVANRLHGTDHNVGAHDKIEGLQHLDKVINIDQQPIGRTPRSNPATYTKAFDPIRSFFAELPESRVRGFQPGRFSFNVKGGRCEACEGQGAVRVEMHFLADVFVPCEVCKGRRFNEQTLEVTYKGRNIADVLDMTVAEARELFADHPPIARILDTLLDVGMGYVKLGQSSTTLSGGEAQRIKLSRELAKRDTGHTLYILDEPTTGLHFEDIAKLITVLQRLVDSGNTVIVIEHNLDVIKVADHIIDLGPEGGAAGGNLVATGSPEELVTTHAKATQNGHHRSHTAEYLRSMLAG